MGTAKPSSESASDGAESESASRLDPLRFVNPRESSFQEIFQSAISFLETSSSNRAFEDIPPPTPAIIDAWSNRNNKPLDEWVINIYYLMSAFSDEWESLTDN